MEVSKDMFVIIEYTVRLKDGVYLKGEYEPASLNFVVDYDQILPALERRLLGLKEGEQADFTIPAREAFGEHDASQVRTKTFEEFPQGRSLEQGKWAVATNEQTQARYSYFVKNKTDRSVTLDFNHPLAGQDLYYSVKIAHIRPALQEELEHLRPCEGYERPQVSSLARS